MTCIWAYLVTSLHKGPTAVMAAQPALFKYDLINLTLEGPSIIFAIYIYVYDLILNLLLQ